MLFLPRKVKGLAKTIKWRFGTAAFINDNGGRQLGARSGKTHQFAACRRLLCQGHHSPTSIRTSVSSEAE